MRCLISDETVGTVVRLCGELEHVDLSGCLSITDTALRSVPGTPRLLLTLTVNIWQLMELSELRFMSNLPPQFSFRKIDDLQS